MRASAASRCTVGTACTSASVLCGRVFARTMPAPPAAATVADLSTRAPSPRSQTTTLPSARAASRLPVSHRRAASGSAPEAATAEPSTRPVARTGWSETIAPTSVRPSPSRTAPWNAWWVLAPTVVTHGATCATVPAPRPSLPAEVATNTPAAVAPRNARSTESSSRSLPDTE